MNKSYFFLKSRITKKNVKYISIVLVIYLFFLVVNLPASVIFSFINLPSNVKVHDVTGTVWKGKIRQVEYSAIDVGSVTWELHPLSLLLGKISVDVSIINNQQFIETELTLSLSGKIELQETRFIIDLSALQPLTYGMPFSYAGKASGYFPISYFYKNNFISVNGKLSLHDIEMISPQGQEFGDFVVDFRAEPGGSSSAKIKDRGGLLSILGDLKLNKNGLLNISVKLNARKEGGSLEKILSFLGSKDDSGKINIQSTLHLW